MKPDEFWNLTYAEFEQMVDAYERTSRNKYNEQITIAYYNAYFQRVEKLPDLKQFLLTEEKQEQTDEDMFNVCQNICTAFGGKVVEV